MSETRRIWAVELPGEEWVFLFDRGSAERLAAFLESQGIEPGESSFAHFVRVVQGERAACAHIAQKERDYQETLHGPACQGAAAAELIRERIERRGEC